MKITALSVGLSLITVLCLALLPSCEGVNFSVSTPYGDASGIGKSVTIAPKPIVVPTK